MALTPEQLAAFQRDRQAGYYNPETGGWVSTGTDANPTGGGEGLYAYFGAGWNKL